MLFMWFYSFVNNLFYFGLTVLMVSLLAIAVIITLRITKEIDPDDFESMMKISVPLMLFGLLVVPFPSLKTVVKNQAKYEALKKEMFEDKIKEEKLTHGEENEKIPAMLSHSCTERMCR